jgi:hypothetical protein
LSIQIFISYNLLKGWGIKRSHIADKSVILMDRS